MSISQWMESKGYELLEGDRAYEREINSAITGLDISQDPSLSELQRATGIIAEYLFRNDMTMARYEASYEARYLISDYLAA